MITQEYLKKITSYNPNTGEFTWLKRRGVVNGGKGVTMFKRDNKWHVRIAVAGKTHHLGIFDDFTEAVAHRLAAEQCLNWGGCDSNSPAYKYIQKYLKKRRWDNYRKE